MKGNKFLVGETIIVLIGMFMVGCGAATQTVTSDNTAGSLAVMPDSVQPFYNEYFRLIGSDQQLKGSIEVQDLSSVANNGQPVMAVCNADGQTYDIQIDANIWASSNTDQQRTIVFHELTHCLYNEPGHAAPDSAGYMVELSNTSFDAQYLYTEMPALVKEFTLGGAGSIKINQQVIN